MQRIITLFDRSSATQRPDLPASLKAAYGGALDFPRPTARPVYVVANFVSTLDGVVSYHLPHKSGGGEISGFNEEDQFIMGLLRNSADAVLFGSRTLRGDSGHVRIPEFIYPRLRDDFRSFRQTVLQKPVHPLNVVMTGSGEIKLDEPTFHTPELSTLIIKAEAGYDRLRRDHGSEISITQVQAVSHDGSKVAPSAALKILLCEEFNLERLVLGGAPTLFGQFLAQGLVDEFFLTLSPQIVGRSEDHPRPSLAAQTSFFPDNSPWFDLVSLKNARSHLYARYKSRATAH